MNESWKAFFLPQLLKKEPTKTKMRKKLLQGEFLGREVEQENSNTDEKNNKQPKVMLFLFIIPILLLILLTGIVLIGLHFIEQDGSSNTSQLMRLAALIVIIAVILLLYCLRLSFPVFKRPEYESFRSAAFVIPADISFVFRKSFGTPT